MGRAILLPLSFLAFLVAYVPAHATSITVPDDYPTLQAAFNSLIPSPIDTIFVRPGVVTDSVQSPNLNGQAVIGLGDSLTRPSIRTLVFAEDATFVNLRFTGAIYTLTQGHIAFRDCRLEAGFTTHINGGPRNVSMVGCRVSGTVLAVSDAFVFIDSCWFDHGSVVFPEDGQLEVTNSTFSGPGNHIAISSRDDNHGVISGNTFREVGTAIRLIEGHYNIANNVIEDCSTGLVINDGASTIRWNAVRRCARGMELSGRVHLRDNLVTDSAGDGIRLTVVENDVQVERNIVGRSGGYGLFIERRVGTTYGLVTVRNNTSYDNAWSGFVFELDNNPAEVSQRLQGGAQDEATHNIGYRNGGHGLLSLGAEFARSCNNWFANDSSAVEGSAPSPDDLAVDPLFCDIDHDGVSLEADSPLLNAPGCGLIGVLGLGCASTPTLVTLFTAERDADGVRVRWQLADPTRFAEVWVERADVVAGPWEMAATEHTTEGGIIVALDRSALVEREYWYRLAAREGTEVVTISEPVSVLGKAHRFELTRVSPNPGFGPVNISFTLSREAAVEVDVIDLQGRHVMSLVHGTLSAGAHTVEWRGAPAATGIYFVDYRYPGGHQVRRVVRLR